MSSAPPFDSPSWHAHSGPDIGSAPRELPRIGRGAVGMKNGYSINSQIVADFDSEAVAVSFPQGLASATRENSMTEPATPRIVNRDEWERARAELLIREKA